MSKGTRYALAAGVLVLLLLLAVAGSYWVAAWEVTRNDQRWCDTLSLLTSTPVPRPADPAANPSRQQTYLFYTDLATLRNQFGCGPDYLKSR